MRLLSIVLLSLSLGACDERRQNNSAVDPDVELMNEPGTAGPELEKRLVASASALGQAFVSGWPITSWITC
jgi:hypothetical protein